MSSTQKNTRSILAGIIVGTFFSLPAFLVVVGILAGWLRADFVSFSDIFQSRLVLPNLHVLITLYFPVASLLALTLLHLAEKADTGSKWKVVSEAVSSSRKPLIVFLMTLAIVAPAVYFFAGAALYEVGLLDDRQKWLYRKFSRILIVYLPVAFFWIMAGSRSEKIISRLMPWVRAHKEHLKKSVLAVFLLLSLLVGIYVFNESQKRQAMRIFAPSMQMDATICFQ